MELKILTTSPLPDAIESVRYPTSNTTPFILESENGIEPITWSYGNFVPMQPLGLFFDSTNKISGIAALGTEGDYTFDITARDSAGKTSTVNFALKIWKKVTLESPADLPVGLPGPATYDYNFIVSGGSGVYTFSAGSNLPNWLTLNPASGNLRGIPPSNAIGQSFSFDITATCSTYAENKDTKTYSLSISPAEIKNFTGPEEVFAYQTVLVEFDLTNHGNSSFSISNDNFSFTHGAGPIGNVDGQYNAIASLSNPTQVAGNTTETFGYHISVSQNPTKASSTMPITVDLEVDFVYSGSPMQTSAPTPVHWACRIWESMPNMPSKRLWGAAAALDDHIYYFGGMDDAGDAKYTIYDFDVVNNTWSTSSVSLRSKSLWHAAVTVGSKIYIIGGNDRINGYNRVYEFNPAVPSITNVGLLLRERYMCAAASNGTEIFVLGSWQNGSIEMFNTLTNTSTGKTATTSGNHGRFLHQAVYYNNKYYTFGGSYIDQYEGYDTVYEFDATADTLTLKTKLNHKVTGHGVTLLNNNAFAICGIASIASGAKNYFQRYNLDTFTVQDCGYYPENLYGNRSVTVDNKIFNIGGASTNTATATYNMRMIEFN
ncbi:MAG: putative Ig domain-containing protein [Planctomycetes bacterium]|nr:putative Ig domain-containing protein [Planctomycetota bacterium]